ncbi:MAG: LptF/LptG family permease [Pseudomonadota bacterium]
MSFVLGNYLRRRVTTQIIGLLLALTGLMQLLALLEVTSDVLERHLGIAGVLRYAALTVPTQMLIALPLAGLLGSMATFYAMARAREITALRSAGVGLWRLLIYLVPVPVLFAALHIALAQKIVPMSEGALKTWWDSTAPLEEHASDPQWVRTSNGILLFQKSSADGRRLLDVRIYLRGSDDLLTLTTRAGEARWDAGHWHLSGARDVRVTAGDWQAGATERDWSSNLTPADVVQLDVADPHLSTEALADVIGGERVSTRPRSYYQTVLLQSLVAPFTVFIMMLLAMPAAIVSERGGGGGRMLLALFFGLGFLLVDGIFSSFGTSGRVSPQLAATAAPAAFALLGFVQLKLCERA